MSGPPRSPSREAAPGPNFRGLERVAATMFARWNQEDFFKYMRERYRLDRLV